MKTLLKVASCLFVAALSLSAGEVKMPKGYFSVADYESAKKTAIAEGKPLAVMLTELETTCPICEATSNDMIKSIRGKVVWVYVPPKTDYSKLPPSVNGEFRTVKVYPFLAIVDPTDGKVLAFTHQKAYSADDRKALKEVKDAVRAYSKK